MSKFRILAHCVFEFDFSALTDTTLEYAIDVKYIQKVRMYLASAVPHTFFKTDRPADRTKLVQVQMLCWKFAVNALIQLGT